MTGNLPHRRWAWPAAALVVLAVVALAPPFGLSTTTPAPLWNDRPLPVAPAPAQAPNWVELAKQLKPAVVNVSTKRVEGGAQMRSPSGPGDPFEQFFRQFGDQPKR